MDERTILQYRNRFSRIILQDGSIIWGKLNDCENGTAVIISSRNDVQRVSVTQIREIV